MICKYCGLVHWYMNLKINKATQKILSWLIRLESSNKLRLNLNLIDFARFSSSLLDVWAWHEVDLIRPELKAIQSIKMANRIHFDQFYLYKIFSQCIYFTLEFKLTVLNQHQLFSLDLVLSLSFLKRKIFFINKPLFIK